MGKKIYLSPSNQDANIYAAGNTNECDQCNRIAVEAEKAMKRCGFDVKRAPKGQAMQTSINESNTWKADLHLPIHTNAGGGAGTMVMVYEKSTTAMKFAQPIYDEVQEISPGKTNYGIKEYPGLAELNRTSAMAVYTEVDFHDNKEIAQWIINNPVVIGEALCKGVCKAYGVTYVPPAAPLPTDTTGFKFGDNNIGVLAYKEVLLLAKKLGIITGGCAKDGDFGDGTLNCTKQVQKLSGITQNGIAGEKTIKAAHTLVEKKLSK